MGSIHVAGEIDRKLLSEHPIDITTVEGQKPHLDTSNCFKSLVAFRQICRQMFFTFVDKNLNIDSPVLLTSNQVATKIQVVIFGFNGLV